MNGQFDWMIMNDDISDQFKDKYEQSTISVLKTSLKDAPFNAVGYKWNNPGASQSSYIICLDSCELMQTNTIDDETKPILSKTDTNTIMYLEAWGTRVAFDSQWEAGGHYVFINAGKQTCTDEKQKEFVILPIQASNT